MLQAISRILFWTYSRGSWQYDVLVLLILCFIFLTPRTVFDGSAFNRLEAPAQELQEPADKQKPAQAAGLQNSEVSASQSQAEAGESKAAR